MQECGQESGIVDIVELVTEEVQEWTDGSKSRERAAGATRTR